MRVRLSGGCPWWLYICSQLGFTSNFCLLLQVKVMGLTGFMYPSSGLLPWQEPGRPISRTEGSYPRHLGILEESDRTFADVLGVWAGNLGWPGEFIGRFGRGGEKTKFRMNLSYACINFAGKIKKEDIVERRLYVDLSDSTWWRRRSRFCSVQKRNSASLVYCKWAE
jgi:hypothetical protein